jgi:hypothetical protein
MNAKEIIKQGGVVRSAFGPHGLNFVLGALSPALSSARERVPTGELLSRSLLSGTGGVAGSAVGRSAGVGARTALTSTAKTLASRGRGKLSRAAGVGAKVAPYLSDWLGFLVGSTAGSKLGKHLYRGSKRVASKKWGKGRPEGVLKRVSPPAASALEAAKTKLI